MKRPLARGFATALSFALTGWGINQTCHAVENGVGKQPYRGWSSWTLEATKYPGYGGAWLTAENIKRQSDAMRATLGQYGYTFINIDSFWSNRFDECGRPTYDIARFPRGISDVASYVHARGQTLGLYWVPGINQSVYDRNPLIQGTPYHVRDIVFAPRQPADAWGGGWKINYDQPGAQEYVYSCARLFASWGVDFLKLDGLTPGSGHTNDGMDARRDVAAWSTALQKTGRPIWLTLSWTLDVRYAADWQCYGNARRIADDVESYGDHLAHWPAVAWRFGAASAWAGLASARKGWNDFDSLPVGNGAMDGLTPDERRTVVTLWALGGSPLYVGDDLTKLDALGRELLTNREVLSVQAAGRPLWQDVGGETQVWHADQADGSLVVALFNLSDTKTQDVTTRWEPLGIVGAARVRDLWGHTDLGEISNQFSATLAPHAARLLRVTPVRGRAITRWRFAPDKGLAPERMATQPTTLPTWQDTTIGLDEFTGQPGTLWFRATLRDNGPPHRGQRTLHFGSADDNATVYLNGQKLGEHRGYEGAFSFTIPAALWRKGQTNELAVRVENTAGPGGLFRRVTLY